MFVDDHNEMFGGVPDALSIRISPEELKDLENGGILKGGNAGRGIQVTVSVEENPKSTSAS